MKPLQHLAIILDGNGRWAKKQNKERTFGHKQGMEKVFDTILWAKKQKIKFLTLFCFSTENWNRPKKEVGYLMKFPGQIFKEKEIQKYIDNKIKINWIGRRNLVPSATKKALENVEQKTASQTEIVVNLAIDYGSDQELETAVHNIAAAVLARKIDLNDINKELIYNKMYTNNSPQVDLLIRTGGEQRLSNFMLFQLRYAEIYFTKVYWPDFSEQNLIAAVEDYYQRDRRFGKIEVEHEKKSD